MPPPACGDRIELVAAAAVRDVVHLHLEHEEPVLFPALRAHVSEAEWADFSKHVIATAPDVGAHLLVGFLEQADNPQDAEIILGGIPGPVRAEMREQPRETFRQLSVAG